MKLLGYSASLFAMVMFAPLSKASESELDRGAYLARIMLCADCHSPHGEDGAPDLSRAFSGGLGFEVPGLGVFWAPNLTPSKTGLADWSEEDIIAALRKGERPDGRELAPIMPWRFFSALTDPDARALARYLKSLPPIENRTPDPIGSGESATAPFLTLVVPSKPHT